MVLCRDIFNSAMGIMDELSSAGKAETSGNREYEYRTPAILNMLVSELKTLLGDYTDWMPMADMDSEVPEVNTSYALGAMAYGLAANLLVDENPTAASFYQQRYEELRNLYIIRQSADSAEIADMYGGIEYGEFSRW